MKTLTLIRHAHAEPGLQLPDFDRSLNRLGKIEAEVQSRRFPFYPNAVVLVSPAKRTLETAQYWIEKQPNINVKTINELYNSDTATLIRCIENFSTEENLVVIAHNPGISELYHELTGDWVPFKPGTMAVMGFSEDCQICEKGIALPISLQFPNINE